MTIPRSTGHEARKARQREPAAFRLPQIRQRSAGKNVEKAGTGMTGRSQIYPPGHCPQADREKPAPSGWRPRRPLTPPGSFGDLLRHNGTGLGARR